MVPFLLFNHCKYFEISASAAGLIYNLTLSSKAAFEGPIVSDLAVTCERMLFGRVPLLESDCITRRLHRYQLPRLLLPLASQGKH